MSAERPAATMAPRPAVPSDAASSLAAPSLAVRGLSKAFGGVEAVKDVSFQVAEGELLALIGPNGAGKSTCFNMLNGQIRTEEHTYELQSIMSMSNAVVCLKQKNIYKPKHEH